MISKRQVAQRVRAGAALLDSTKPTWYKKVNLTTLNLGSCYHCVLGQVFNEYSQGAYALGLTLFSGDMSKYGFVASQYGEYALLRLAWKDVIKKRKAK